MKIDVRFDDEGILTRVCGVSLSQRQGALIELLISILLTPALIFMFTFIYWIT